MAAEAAEEHVRVLIADDSEPFRDGLVALLGAAGGTVVVGAAEDGQAVIDQTLALQPDLVLMDLEMPDIGGIEATRTIVATSPHVAVLVLSAREDEEALFSAIQAGARGYLLKGTRQAELLRAIRTVAAGGGYFGPALARRLIDFFGSAGVATPSPLASLTPREGEVLRLIAKGRSNMQIAEQLALSPKTVRNHVSNVLTKLQVADRAEAIAKAHHAD